MQRGRAGKGGSEVGRGCRNLPTSVFRVVRARSAWGEEPEKVSRPLRAACRRATLRVQGAPGRVSGRRGGGVRHGTGHGRRDPPGMGCGPSAVAGALARVTSGRRVEDGGAFPSRGAATLIGTASPVPLAADVRTRSLAVRLFVARNGYGAARHVRLLMCDKEAIEVQKILPFLSDTWPLCRIGRAVIRASPPCQQKNNKSQCPVCGSCHAAYVFACHVREKRATAGSDYSAICGSEVSSPQRATLSDQQFLCRPCAARAIR